MGETPFPETGATEETVFKEISDRKHADMDWRGGRVWSLVYHVNDEIASIRDRAYEQFASENALGSSVFPSLRQFENEIVSMTADLLNGDKTVAGNVTSGGTESILLAVQTARDWGRDERSIDAAEMILPETAHPAFAKAAHYFDVDVTRVETGDDWRADPDAMADAVSENTVLLVGSAPSYPHGVVDPIEDIASIAREHDVLCHVDSCIGGFILPFLGELDYDIPAFDFSVDGVTSISVDPHKYGYTAKGTSTIMYANDDIRKYQYFAYEGWPGGVYSAPTMCGTRPGGTVAGSWAVMRYLGRDGYLPIVRRVMNTTSELMNGIESIDGLSVVSDPDMCIFSFGSETDELDSYAVHEHLSESGWATGRQQDPPSIHLSVMPTHEPIVEKFLDDLETAVNETWGESSSYEAALYGGGGSMESPDDMDVETLAIEAMSETYR